MGQTCLLCLLYLLSNKKNWLLEGGWILLFDSDWVLIDWNVLSLYWSRTIKHWCCHKGKSFKNFPWSIWSNGIPWTNGTLIRLLPILLKFFIIFHYADHTYVFLTCFLLVVYHVPSILQCYTLQLACSKSIERGFYHVSLSVCWIIETSTLFLFSISQGHQWERFSSCLSYDEFQIIFIPLNISLKKCLVISFCQCLIQGWLYTLYPNVF